MTQNSTPDFSEQTPNDINMQLLHTITRKSRELYLLASSIRDSYEIDSLTLSTNAGDEFIQVSIKDKMIDLEVIE